MKKKILLSILIVGLLICTGCNKKKEDNKKSGKTTGGWEVVFADKQANIDENAKAVFNKALEELDGANYEAIALLGKQVVSGTNYMFLCKITPVVPDAKSHYSIVVIYNDLEGNATITGTTDFKIEKYIDENTEYDSKDVVGGFEVVVPEYNNTLEDDIQTMFDNATETLTGMTYQPIAVLGKQVVSGTNYALLAYGSMSTASTNNGIYLLKLYNSLENTSEIASSTYIDLADFNK